MVDQSFLPIREYSLLVIALPQARQMSCCSSPVQPSSGFCMRASSSLMSRPAAWAGASPRLLAQRARRCRVWLFRKSFVLFGGRLVLLGDTSLFLRAFRVWIRLKKNSNIQFDPALLQSLCSHVLIPAKEGREEADIEDASGSVLVPFDPMLPTQNYLLSEIARGKALGKNTFYVLKCRQSGVTTLGLGIALLWAFQHAGLIFCFIADTATRLVLNRRLAQQFIVSLKKVPAWRQEVEENNRYFVSFKNGSAIYWLNSNSDDEGGLGRSIGATASWGTELGCWKDEEGTLSLLSSISENNPLGLHVFEGTAKGPNLFKELYDLAARPDNTTQEAIFIGWWLHPWYEHCLSDPRHRQRFDIYWGALPRLTRDEAGWVEGVKLRYGFDIRPTQISWWRWHLRERKKDNLALMYQEYPPLPEHAWTYGGNSFINGHKLSVSMSRAVAARTEPKRYFIFDPGDGVRFENSDMIEVDASTSYYDLVCFSPPCSGPRVRYCLGCDPAHGAHEQSDHAAIEVFQCYSDKALQVAEWVKREVPTYQIAWVILHLVGVYNSGESETHLNIEMQGGGVEVYQEIKRLQAEMAYGYAPKLARYFQKISHYLYARGDSTHGATSTLHWETTYKTRPRMLHNFKNLLERDMLELKSEELIAECATLQQLRTGEIESGSQNHRLMAAAIGAMAYIQVLDMDIGGREEYLSSTLKEVHDKDPHALSPDQFMKILSDGWRERLLSESLSSTQEGETPPWLWMEGDSLDLYQG